MANKRVTRKQLLKEPDEFITFSNRMIKLGVVYKNQLLLAGGVFCLAVLIFVGVQYASNRSQAKALALLDGAVTRYEQSVAQEGPLKALAAVETDFDAILKNYASNAGGKLARATYAQYRFAAGQADGAIMLYEQALDDFQEDPFYRSIIVSGLGYAWALKGDSQKSISYFEQVVASPAAAAKSDALFNLGLLYEQAGQRDKSIAAFKRIQDEFPTSPYAELAGGKANL